MIEQPRSPPAGGPAIVPPWFRRVGAIAWRLLAVSALAAGIGWLAIVLGTVVASVLLALIAAATFAPLVRRLQARGWSSAQAAAAATLASFLGGVAVIVLIAVALVPSLGDLFAATSEGTPETAALQPVIAGLGSGVRSWVADNLATIGARVVEVATIVILAIFLTYFLLEGGARAWRWGIQAARAPQREHIEASGRDALERVGGYLRGTAILSATSSVIFLIFFLILGLPLAVPLAILVFVSGFVPYLGNLAVFAVVGLVALGSIGWQMTLLLIALMAVTWTLQANLLRPWVYGRSVRLHPALVLVAIPIGGYVAGIVGVIVAIPVVALALALGGAALDLLTPRAGESASRDVPGWLDRLAQWSWRILAVTAVAAAILWVIAQVPFVVVPVLMAIVIAAIVAPLARRLQRRGWSVARAALLVTGGAYTAALLFIVIATVQLAQPIEAVIAGALAGGANAAEATGLEWITQLSATVGAEILAAVGAVLGAGATIAVALVLAALLSFYFVRDGLRLWAGIAARIAPWRRVHLEEAGGSASTVLGGYVIGTAVISAVGALTQFVIMIALGLPFAAPIMVLSFIACFIPYIGGFVTTGLALLVAVAYGTPVQIGVMIAFTLVINIVQGNLVTPIVYARTVQLHPALVLLAIPAGGALAGIAGMFLAVPLLAVVAATWRSLLRSMDDEPRSSRPAAGPSATVRAPESRPRPRQDPAGTPSRSRA